MTDLYDEAIVKLKRAIVMANELIAERDALKQCIVDLERDGERLDFIIKLLIECGGVVHLMNLNLIDYENRTLDRATIDAAIASQKT